MGKFDYKKECEIHIEKAKKAVENYRLKILQLNTEINEWQMFLEDHEDYLKGKK